MARYFAAVIFCFGLALPAWATTNYVYPTYAWDVSTHQGEEIGSDLYHMGVDVASNLPAGTPIYAVADGVVKEARERSQFGLVVLIEHSPDGEDKNVSLYGHLDPGDVRVAPGDHVNAGDVIGVLGSTEVNGGWGVHLHFGIYKAAYTGVWVYYGHVHDPATADNWHDPETYLPEHFSEDHLKPVILWDQSTDEVIDDTMNVNAFIGDVGSARLKNIKVRIKTETGYDVVRSLTDPSPLFSQSLDLHDYPDGNITIQLVARDASDNKTVAEKTFFKDPLRFSTPALVGMLGGQSSATISQWSFGGTTLNSFNPFKTSWNLGGLLVVGPLDTGEDTRVVAIRPKTSTTIAQAKVFTPTGTLLRVFDLQNKPVAAAVSEGKLWVADGAGVITVYDSSGTILQQSMPSERSWTSLAVEGDVVMGCSRDKQVAHVVQLNSDLTEAKVWRAFKKHTGCSVALADVTGDTVLDVIVGTTGRTPALAKVTKLNGKIVVPPFAPFGDGFTGKLGVTTTQWDMSEDTTNEAEVIFAQSSGGQSWVKTYRFSAGSEIVTSSLIADESWVGGSLVAGWQ